jgi:hypothetical protein
MTRRGIIKFLFYFTCRQIGYILSRQISVFSGQAKFKKQCIELFLGGLFTDPDKIELQKELGQRSGHFFGNFGTRCNPDSGQKSQHLVQTKF